MDRSSLDEEHIESRAEYSPSHQRENLTRTFGFAILSILLSLALVVNIIVADSLPVIDELLLLVAAGATGYLALRSTA